MRGMAGGGGGGGGLPVPFLHPPAGLSLHQPFPVPPLPIHRQRSTLPFPEVPFASQVVGEHCNGGGARGFSAPRCGEAGDELTANAIWTRQPTPKLPPTNASLIAGQRHLTANQRQ